MSAQESNQRTGSLYTVVVFIALDFVFYNTFNDMNLFRLGWRILVKLPKNL